MKTAIMRLLVLVLIALCIGCESKYEKQRKAQAVESARLWLKKVDAAYYQKSWYESSEYLQKTIIRSDWQLYLMSYRSPLGDVVSREIQTIEQKNIIRGAPYGHYYEIIYKTRFEHEREQVEEIVFMKVDEDQEIRVVGYKPMPQARKPLRINEK